jgi:hypothetical protein
MSALMPAAWHRPNREDVHFVDADLDPTDGEEAVPVQPLLDNFFSK